MVAIIVEMGKIADNTDYSYYSNKNVLYKSFSLREGNTYAFPVITFVLVKGGIRGRVGNWAQISDRSLLGSTVFNLTQTKITYIRICHVNLLLRRQ